MASNSKAESGKEPKYVAQALAPANARAEKATEEERTERLQTVDKDLLEQANELVRGAEVLPDGATGLAHRLKSARDQGKKFRVKLGIDPTSTDLHLGHAVLFRKLKRFQDFGHQVVLIIGGFTAQIGDPSGRNATRVPLSAEQVASNANTYLDQIGLILDLAKTEVTNNADWLTGLDLEKVLKIAGTVTVNQLLAKEAFGERMEKQLPISFHEMFYPLLQAYDSVAVKADIELGGTDQRFNNLQGRELQPYYGQEPQMVMLLPILEGTDGVRKMSKSFDNYIGLRELPESMFGKCMRISDELIGKYFEFATDLSGAEIDRVKDGLSHGGNPKDAKLRLAEQIVSQYWGSDTGKKELEQWNKLHSHRQLPSKDDMPSYVVKPGMPLFRILVESGLASGSGEAKRLIAEGAVRFCEQTITEPNHVLFPINAVPFQTSGQGKATELGPLQVGRRKFCFLHSS
jgi:tyrosyl-tRNA synthetase